MQENKISFRPVKFRAEGEVFESTISSFFRSLALFRECLGAEISDLKFLDKASRRSKFILTRILEIGNFNHTKAPMDFVQRHDPFPFREDSQKALDLIETIEEYESESDSDTEVCDL